MQIFFISLLRCSIAMSMISLVYIAVMPLLSKRYSAKWIYYIWLLVVFGWVLPFRLHLDHKIIPIQLPEIQVPQVDYISLEEPMNIITNESQVITPVITLWWFITAIWIVGMIGIFINVDNSTIIFPFIKLF